MSYENIVLGGCTLLWHNGHENHCCLPTTTTMAHNSFLFYFFKCYKKRALIRDKDNSEVIVYLITKVAHPLTIFLCMLFLSQQLFSFGLCGVEAYTGSMTLSSSSGARFKTGHCFLGGCHMHPRAQKHWLQQGNYK